MNRFILSFILLFIFSNSFAQMDKADKLFADYKYAQAIILYKPIAEKGNIKAINKIAECYRVLNDYDNAEKYYAIAVKDKNATSSSYFHYAQLLINNEKCDMAKIWLEKFLSSKPDKDSTLARTLLKSCINPTIADSIGRKLTVQNMKALNSPFADFCAFYYDGGIAFTSARQDVINGASGSGYQEVLLATYESDTSFNIAPLKGVVNTKGYNSGPACIDSLRDIIYFTKNNFQFGDAVSNQKGEVTLKIFSAKKAKDGWRDVKEINLNDKEYSSAFPSINNDGNILYFTSDRTGGYGGKDIYFSTLSNGVWSKPKNAGPNINTAGDERYPFIHIDGTLYFSSTGWPGYGGMDIFKATPSKAGEFGKPENLGKPFNSTTDDFGFFIDNLYGKGFFSSDRSGGVGGDDIYSFTYSDIPLDLNLYNNGKPADSILISIKKGNEVIQTNTFNKKTILYLEPNTHYTFDCTKEGFNPEQFNIRTTNNKKPLRKSVNLTNY